MINSSAIQVSEFDRLLCKLVDMWFYPLFKFGLNHENRR